LTDQGLVYASFIETQLQREFERRDKVDARAATVVGASGLVAIAAATVAVLRGNSFTLHGAAAAALIVALLAFLISAALATSATFAWKYDVAEPETLQRMLDDHWSDPEASARRDCATVNIRTVTSLRKGNNRKVNFFVAALAAHVVAIAFLAAAVCLATA
jgi:hypothetical protein